MRQTVATLTCATAIASLANACARPPQAAPPRTAVAFEQLRRTEAHRSGAIVSVAGNTYQVQLTAPERVMIPATGVAAEIAQEIIDRRTLLATRIVRVYVESPEQPDAKIDVTDKATVTFADRDRVTLTATPDLGLRTGQKLYFKHEKIRLAPVGGRATPGGLPEGLIEELTSHLANTDEFTVLERTRIDAVIAEHKLSMDDLIDPDTAARAGRLFGAEAILIGSISDVGGKRAANVRVVDVTRGEVILAVRRETTVLAAATGPPRVVSVIPADGAKNVSASLSEIVIVFDRPMRSNWNVTCAPAFVPERKECTVSHYWRDHRTFVFAIPPLERGKTYSFTVNGLKGTPRFTESLGFRALDSTPADAERFFFTLEP